MQEFKGGLWEGDFEPQSNGDGSLILPTGAAGVYKITRRHRRL